ncbi:hypothetical protein OHT68_12115 [Streptomyces canus]|uniref:hypothetical protein n=1 Tax=Streptomyces canus TaxID=58343 RepID=UPI002E2CF6E1|nr:hypothetical protein [Streptomyces canus]
MGLTDALAGVLPSGTASSWRDRAAALIGLVVAIALGATNLLEAEQLQLHHGPLFGPAVSDSTLHRLLSTTDETRRAQIAKERQRVRRHIWTLLHLRPGGFPYLTVAGRHLKGWIVLDMDATVITPRPPGNRALPARSRAPSASTRWPRGRPTPTSAWRWS